MAISSKVFDDRFQSREGSIGVWETEHLTMEGKIALAMVERWGLVQGQEDGEDSSGRAKLKLMVPEDVVARAMTVTELFITAVRSRNWTTIVPSFEEADAIIAERARIRDEKNKENGKKDKPNLY